MPKTYHHLSKRRKNQLISLHISTLDKVATTSNVPKKCIETNSNVEMICNDSNSEVTIFQNKPYTNTLCSNNTLDSSNNIPILSMDNYNSSTSNSFDISITSNEDNSSLSNFSTESIDFNNKISVQDEQNFSLQEDLQILVSECCIPQSTVDKLLLILRKHGHDLPQTCRTLMKTPRNTFQNISSVSNGRYIHFGLASGINRSISKYCRTMPCEVKININIDGLPLSQSSGSQFWPILASIEIKDLYTEPFAVGMFHGMSKPNNVNDFLRPFVNEAQIVLREGVSSDNEDIHCKVLLNAILCDAPAKSMITCTKGHTGYSSCSKCSQEGDFICNRVVFPEINSTLRTNESFRNRSQEEHHVGDSILENLPIDMISQIPLDYMHLFCLGSRRLLQFYVRGKKGVRLSNTAIDSIDKHLLDTRKFIIKEFARLPRSLLYVDSWKATEVRLFVLYLGLVLLKPFLSEDYYNHFLSLSIAIRILADPERCLVLNDFAHSLITWFISQYGNMFGLEYLSHNVHNLEHLANDVKTLGCLDAFSCFKFENHMQKIKKRIKNCGKPLEEYSNRILELNQLPPEKYYLKSYPIIHFKKAVQGSNDISHLEFNGFTIFTKENENCCLLNDNSLVFVLEIILEGINDVPYISVKRILLTKPFFSTPCDSKELLGIQTFTEINPFNIEKLPATNIKTKCLKLKHLQLQDTFVIIPLLHART